MICPHCNLENKCADCGKEVEVIGRADPKTNKVWCLECYKVIVVAEKNQSEEELKKGGFLNGTKIGGMINRDYTEKLYREHFRFQVTKRDKLIESHRKKRARNEKQQIKLSRQEQDYVTKATEHLN